MGMGGSVNKVVNYTTRLSGAGNARTGLQNMARGAAVAGAAIIGAGVALFRLTDRLTETAAATEDMSRRLGIAADELAALGYIAEQDGSSIDGVQTAIRRMARTINDAEDGLTTYIRTFDQLGLSVDELSGRAPEEQFYILADAIREVEDDSTRLALAQELFGRAATDLLPTLMRGSEEMRAMGDEARELGIVLDAEAYAKSKQFQDALLEMETQLQSVMLDAIIPLLPEIQELAELIMDVAVDAIPDMIDAAGNLMPVLEAMVEAILLAADGWARLLRVGEYDSTEAFQIIAQEANQTVLSLDEMAAAWNRLYDVYPGLRPGTAAAREGLIGLGTQLGELLGGSGEPTAALGPDTGGLGIAPDIEEAVKEAMSLKDLFKEMADIEKSLTTEQERAAALKAEAMHEQVAMSQRNTDILVNGATDFITILRKGGEDFEEQMMRAVAQILLELAKAEFGKSFGPIGTILGAFL